MPSAALRRASNKQLVLKPQDFAVALKLVLLRGKWNSYADLAQAMSLSPFEAHAAVQRLIVARLVVERDGGLHVVLPALRAFAIYGAPHSFPATRGELTVGMPTAYGMSPLKDKVLFADELPPVWPTADGEVRGQAILPLYEKLPRAARADPKLYELLALFDALRIGQARERELARTLLEERLQ